MEKQKPYSKNKFTNSKIHIKSHHDGYITIDIEKIQYCFADENYTKIILEGYDRGISISRPLCYFEKLLTEKDFLRCHNSYLVNIRKIESFSSRDRNIIYPDHIIPVSRRKCRETFWILSENGIRDKK
jgi:two-component system LytT family response regulator